MTFTKGVGSPKYMAPEILNRKKYNMPADIFSFAITMLEVSVWNNAFPLSQFRFTWDIADYISDGKRPSLINTIQSQELQQLIQLSWCQNPKERLTIDYIVSLLETQLIKLNKN